MKRLLLFFLTAFTSACYVPAAPSPEMLKYVETTFNPAVFAQGKKAAVIIEATNDLPAKDPMVNKLTFRNKKNGDLFFVETTGREVLMIPQGDYEMISFVIEGSMGLTHSVADLTPRYKASFSVKDGDVAYLGHIKTHVVLGKKEYNSFGPSTQSVRSHTFLLNGIDSLPPNFLRLVEFHTGKEPVSKLIDWRKNLDAGYSR